MSKWTMAEGYERPTGKMERVSKQPHYFSKTLRKGQIAKQLGVDGPMLTKMIKAKEVVLV